MRFFRNGFAVASIVTLSSLPAWAEESADKGLPQFDTSLFPEQLFWLAVTFGALYLLMSKIALPRVSETQSKRRQIIASEIEAARAASDAAKAAAAVAEKSLAEARAKAQASVSEMMAQIAEETAKAQVAQDHTLQRHLHSAEEKIAVARQAGLNAIHSTVTELATVIVDKVINDKKINSGGRVGA